MRLTPIKRAVGHELARDLPTAAGRVPLLARGVVITERYARALAAHGINAVWIHDELSEGIEPAELLSEAVRARTGTQVRLALDSARAAFSAKQPIAPGALSDLSNIV